MVRAAIAVAEGDFGKSIRAKTRIIHLYLIVNVGGKVGLQSAEARRGGGSQRPQDESWEMTRKRRWNP